MSTSGRAEAVAPSRLNAVATVAAFALAVYLAWSASFIVIVETVSQVVSGAYWYSTICVTVLVVFVGSITRAVVDRKRQGLHGLDLCRRVTLVIWLWGLLLGAFGIVAVFSFT